MALACAAGSALLCAWNAPRWRYRVHHLLPIPLMLLGMLHGTRWGPLPAFGAAALLWALAVVLTRCARAARHGTALLADAADAAVMSVALVVSALSGAHGAGVAAAPEAQKVTGHVGHAAHAAATATVGLSTSVGDAAWLLVSLALGGVVVGVRVATAPRRGDVRCAGLLPAAAAGLLMAVSVVVMTLG